MGLASVTFGSQSIYSVFGGPPPLGSHRKQCHSRVFPDFCPLSENFGLLLIASAGRKKAPPLVVPHWPIQNSVNGESDLAKFVFDVIPFWCSFHDIIDELQQMCKVADSGFRTSWVSVIRRLHYPFFGHLFAKCVLNTFYLNKGCKC